MLRAGVARLATSAGRSARRRERGERSMGWRRLRRREPALRLFDARRSRRRREQGVAAGPFRTDRRTPAQSVPKVALRVAVYVHHGAAARAAHEVGRGHEGVEHARVLALAGRFAQAPVERVGVLAAQVGGPLDADPAQVGGERRADVGQLLERARTRRRCSPWGLDHHRRSRPVTSACCCGSGRPRGPRSRTLSPGPTTIVLNSGFSACSSMPCRACA